MPRACLDQASVALMPVQIAQVLLAVTKLASLRLAGFLDIALSFNLLLTCTLTSSFMLTPDLVSVLISSNFQPHLANGAYNDVIIISRWRIWALMILLSTMMPAKEFPTRLALEWHEVSLATALKVAMLSNTGF